MKVLNVGSGADTVLPSSYQGWDVATLDIDAECNPNILLDGRELKTLPEGEYDAVYCSHNLEHYYAHEVPVVLGGFLHVLKAGGFAEVQVPDMRITFRAMLERDLELTDIYYRSPSGPVTFHDTIYGFNKAMKDGNLFFAHKCGFTAQSLGEAMQSAGFKNVSVSRVSLHAVAKGIKG